MLTSLLLSATAISAVSAWRTPVLQVDAPPSRSVTLQCPECAPAVHSLVDEPVPSLSLNFSVSDTAPYDVLLNGIGIYPQASPLPEPLFAPVTKAGDDHATVKVRLGYELDIRRNNWIYPPHVEDVSLSFSVVQVAGQFTKAPETVEIKLLKTPDSRPHLIHALTVKPALDGNASPSEQDQAGGAKGCSRLPLFCKWKAILAQKLAKLTKPHKCHHGGKHMAHHVPSIPVDQPAATPPTPPTSPTTATIPTPEKQAEVFRVQHHRHGKHHRQPLVKKLILHVIFPMLVGIAAGLTASLMGMIVGHLVVLVWRRFYRGNNSAIIGSCSACPASYRYLPLLFHAHPHAPSATETVRPGDKAPSYEEAIGQTYRDEKVGLLEEEVEDIEERE
ncbi:MAG: hypothetical protein M1838_005900 [Thelocarpon superellum]|nr:MAG: hypothetical protein M1838_005900 [Thelocarpon superellum]